MIIYRANKIDYFAFRLKQLFMMNLGPIHVPYRYNKDDNVEQKVIYALAQLGEADGKGILKKLQDENEQDELNLDEINQILDNLFKHGLIKGDKTSEGLKYNLSKIITQNSGKTNLNGLDEKYL